jgi:hypothetical protein
MSPRHYRSSFARPRRATAQGWIDLSRRSSRREDREIERIERVESIGNIAIERVMRMHDRKVQVHDYELLREISISRSIATQSRKFMRVDVLSRDLSRFRKATQIFLLPYSSPQTCHGTEVIIRLASRQIPICRLQMISGQFSPRTKDLESSDEDPLDPFLSRPTRLLLIE